MGNQLNIRLNRDSGDFEHYDPHTNRFSAITAGMTEQLDEKLRSVIRSNDPEVHRTFAQTIVGPIKTYADYQEWTKGILEHQTARLSDVVRVALDSPTMIGFLTVPNGSPNFLRPGRKFATVDKSMFDAALEIGQFDQELFGWNVLAKKIKEAGEELARKRDDIRISPVDTAVEALSGHTSSVATTMTKASVDAIFNAAATAGFKITNVRVNTGTIMDMTSWTWPSNSMWNRLGPDRAEQVVKQGYVYFFAEPSLCGFEWEYETDGAQYNTAYDIRARSNLYVWTQFMAAYAVANAIWRLEIT